MLNIVPECYGQYFHDTTYRFPTDLLGRVLWCKAQFDPSFRGFEEMIQIAVSIYPVIKDGKIVNSPWIFSMIFPWNISHIYDFPISAAQWLGGVPSHCYNPRPAWFHHDFTPRKLGRLDLPGKKTRWAMRRTRQSSQCISGTSPFLLILVLAVVFFACFCRPCHPYHKKIPESQSISVGEASTIRTKHKNMGYTRSTNVFLLAGTWKTSSWWSREILGKLHQLYPESTWWFPEIYTRRGPKPPEVSTLFGGPHE